MPRVPYQQSSTLPGTWPKFNEETRSFGKDHLAKITIEIGTKKGSMFFRAHGLVLSLASKVFHNAIHHPTNRKERNVIEFKYQNPHAYWRMLDWIYTGEYSHESSTLPDFSEDEDSDELLRHVIVFCLANNFQIAGLRKYALRRFEAKVQEYWPVRPDVFCLLIKNIYYNTTEEDGDILRESVVKFVVYNPTVFFQEECFYELAAWAPEFGEACIRELAGAVERPLSPGFADDERSASNSWDESDSEEEDLEEPKEPTSPEESEESEEPEEPEEPEEEVEE